MKKQTIFSLKNIWFASQICLLATAVFSSLAHDDYTFGISQILLIAMSYPLNMIVGWMFIAFGEYFTEPGAMLLMMTVMSAIGYVQWFELMPRIARLFSRKFARHDMAIRVNIEANQICAPADDLNINKWQSGWYDENGRTPLERIFARDKVLANEKREDK